MLPFNLPANRVSEPDAKFDDHTFLPFGVAAAQHGDVVLANPAELTMLGNAIPVARIEIIRGAVSSSSAANATNGCTADIVPPTGLLTPVSRRFTVNAPATDAENVSMASLPLRSTTSRAPLRVKNTSQAVVTESESITTGGSNTKLTLVQHVNDIPGHSDTDWANSAGTGHAHEEQRTVIAKCEGGEIIAPGVHYKQLCARCHHRVRLRATDIHQAASASIEATHIGQQAVLDVAVVGQHGIGAVGIGGHVHAVSCACGQGEGGSAQERQHAPRKPRIERSVE